MAAEWASTNVGILFLSCPAQEPSMADFKCSAFSAYLTGLLISNLFKRRFLSFCPFLATSLYLFCPFISRTIDSDVYVFVHSCRPQVCNWCAMRKLADTSHCAEARISQSKSYSASQGITKPYWVYLRCTFQSLLNWVTISCLTCPAAGIFCVDLAWQSILVLFLPSDS